MRKTRMKRRRKWKATPLLGGRKKKREASTDPEEEAPKRGKIALSDGSDSEAEPIPKRLPRVKPLAEL